MILYNRSKDQNKRGINTTNQSLKRDGLPHMKKQIAKN